MSTLTSAIFLTVTSAVLWIGLAVAAPLPLSYTGNSRGLLAAVMRGQAPIKEIGEVDANLSTDLRREVVDFSTKLTVGTVIIDTAHTYLYYVLGDGKAIRYGIGVGP